MQYLRFAQRSLEVLLGVVVSIVGLVPIAMVVSIVSIWGRGTREGPIWVYVVGLIVSGSLAYWCAVTAWRLVMNRERRDGGLLSPTVLIITGLALAVGAAAGVVTGGTRALGSAVVVGVTALSAFRLAQSRLSHSRPRL